MGTTGSIEDRMLIEDLYGRYADASCRGDSDAWLACFTEDGQWNTHIFRCAGHAEMREQWKTLWADWDKVAFWCNIATLRISDDTATARSYAREIVALSAGGLFKLFGSYDDTMVRRNGQWLYSHRDYLPMIVEAPE